jgi:hypothetical protein
MVAKQPEDRYQGATEVIADVQACLEPAETTSGPPPEAGSTDSHLQSFLELLPREGVADSRQKAKRPQGSSKETVVSQAERQTAGNNQGQEAAVPARKWLALAVAAGAVLVLLLIAMLVSVLILGGNEGPPAENASGTAPVSADAENGKQDQSHLVLVWNEAERGDATLEIDGRTVDILKYSTPANGGQIKVPLEHGERALWIARRGFEPIQQRISVVKGKDIVIELIWKELSTAQAFDESSD